MAGYKAMPLVIVRQRIRAAGVEVERRLLDELTDTEQRLYASMVATAWVPVEFATKIYVTAAPLLYPDEANPVRRIGRALAEQNLAGVYRVIVRILSVPMLVEKTRSLWRAYHDQGVAKLETETGRSIHLTVTEYPDLPERMRESISGWLARAVEMTGAKNVAVVKSDDDPSRWTWTVTWK